MNNSNTIVLGRPAPAFGTAPDKVVVQGDFQAGKIVGGAYSIIRLDGTVYVSSGGLYVDQLYNNGTTALCTSSSAPYLLSFCSSSLRYKKDVENFSSGLDLVKRLRPVTFTWKSNNQRDLGFVAEEVNTVEPLMTTYNNKGEVEGVKYDRISAVLVNAVNEQQTQIETQKTQIETQRKTIEHQQRQIDALVKMTCAANPSADVCRPEEK